MFYILAFKEIKKEVAPKWYWINTYWYANILFKNHLTNGEEAVIDEERHSIGKSLFSEVSFCRSPRSSINKCFRKANAFSDSRFEDKIDYF